jgi:hypothetical protein
MQRLQLVSESIDLGSPEHDIDMRAIAVDGGQLGRVREQCT